MRGGGYRYCQTVLAADRGLACLESSSHPRLERAARPRKISFRLRRPHALTTCNGGVSCQLDMAKVYASVVTLQPDELKVDCTYRFVDFVHVMCAKQPVGACSSVRIQDCVPDKCTCFELPSRPER